MHHILLHYVKHILDDYYAGKKSNAVKEYETFLDTWKDAEREWPEMTDARVRLARLKQ